VHLILGKKTDLYYLLWFLGWIPTTDSFVQSKLFFAESADLWIGDRAERHSLGELS
jgi:hypothetical protein